MCKSVWTGPAIDSGSPTLDRCVDEMVDIDAADSVKLHGWVLLNASFGTVWASSYAASSDPDTGIATRD